MSPKVSIIIPCFYGARWLKTCIQSILNQSVSLEIIIVDDFSTDDSWNIITQLSIEYSSVFMGLKNDNKGGNIARRFGFEKSTGEFIQWLDVDDILLPGKLKAQIYFLENNPLVDIVYSDWQIDKYNEKDELITSEFKLSSHSDDFLLDLLKDNWKPPHCYLSKRAIISEMYQRVGWNPNTQVFQDREYFTRAAIYQARFSYLPGIYVVYNRVNNTSVSQMFKGKERALHEITLLSRFKEEIKLQTWINPPQKKEYERVMYSRSIYLATYYSIPLNGRKNSLANIQWIKINGFAQKARILKNILLRAWISSDVLPTMNILKSAKLRCLL